MIWTRVDISRLSLSVFSALAIVWPATQSRAQLMRVVPDSAFLAEHVVADEDIAFVDHYWLEVMQACIDERFDNLFLEALEAGGMPPEECAKLRSLRDVFYELIDRVDWTALTENEHVFAMRIGGTLTAIPSLLPSMLFAFQPDADRIPHLEKTIRDLIYTVASIKPDMLSVEASARGETGSRVYSLHLMPLGNQAVLQMAVHEQEIMLVMGPQFFEEALACLEGTSDASLINTERFASAFGELPPDAPRRSFVDVHKAIADAKDRVLPLLGDPFIMTPNSNFRQMAEEAFELIDVVDTVGHTAYGEDYTVVDQWWVRFREQAVAEGNPLYQAFFAPREGNDLLSFIPAEASSFTLSSGVDLAPLYRWAIERFEVYGQEEEVIQALSGWDTAQAALDLDFEKDVLSILNSDTVMFTVPALRPTPMQPEDYAYLVRLKNPSGTRKLIKRIENVYEAALPLLISATGNDGDAPNIRFRDADGIFPGMKTVSVTFQFAPGFALPMPEFTYGILGNMLVVTNSQDTLALAMEVAAEESDGLAESPLFVTSDRLPKDSVKSASLTPYGLRYASMQGVMQMAITGANMGFSMAGGIVTQQGAGNQGNAAAAVIKSMAGLLPRISRIIEHIDFLEDNVLYSQTRESGHVQYLHSTTRFFEPHERPTFSGK